MQTTCIDPAQVEDFWPHVAHFIAAAFERGRGDDSAEIVHADLITGYSLLWIAWDGEAIRAAATTKIKRVTRGLVCVVTACGGHRMGLAAWRRALPPIEAYAAAEGCFALRFHGRDGWRRVFPDYREAWTTMEKRL